MWLEEDTEAVLEWQREQDALCSGCGHPRDESMSKSMQGGYRARKLRCHACIERERAAEKHSDEGGDMAGLYFAIEQRHDSPLGGSNR